jgi:hypothetical protein
VTSGVGGVGGRAPRGGRARSPLVILYLLAIVTYLGLVILGVSFVVRQVGELAQVLP